MDDISVSGPLAGQTARAARVAFCGERRAFRRLVVRGALLELCTAGFYRFWLATDIRRHLWSHTALEGDAAEYTGTAKELLIGFLVALAILVPVYLVYLLIGIEAERAQAFASVPLVVFFYAFGQFAIFRARRYRASRTVWRGVRFWMNGSGWNYAWRACLWTLLALVTLGLALPWREAALERFKMRHTFYGDLPARFVGTGWQLFKRVWWLWLLSLPLVTLPFTYPIYKAMSWRWWISGIRFGAVRLQSDMPAESLLGLYWAVLAWSFLVLVADIAMIGLALAALAAAIRTTDWQVIVHTLSVYAYGLFAANIVNYLVLASLAGMLFRIYLLRGVWERVAGSVTVHNLEAADNVQARGGPASALGEGFADSLDIGGF